MLQLLADFLCLQQKTPLFSMQNQQKRATADISSLFCLFGARYQTS